MDEDSAGKRAGVAGGPVVAALVVLLGLGSVSCWLAPFGLVVPGSGLDRLWVFLTEPRPDTQAAAATSGFAAVAFLAAAWATAAHQLWLGRRSGRTLGCVLLAVSLAGDVSGALVDRLPAVWIEAAVVLGVLVTLLGLRAETLHGEGSQHWSERQRLSKSRYHGKDKNEPPPCAPKPPPMGQTRMV